VFRLRQKPQSNSERVRPVGLRSGVASFADRARSLAGEAARVGWDRFSNLASIRAGSPRARRFRSFGELSVIAFPVTALFGEEYIDIGRGCIFGPGLSLSAGVSPGHVIDPANRVDAVMDVAVSKDKIAAVEIQRVPVRIDDKRLISSPSRLASSNRHALRSSWYRRPFQWASEP